MDFAHQIKAVAADGTRCLELAILQLNLGRLCNLECAHCHLDCSPAREELMPRRVMEQVLRLSADMELTRVDLTGGAPELHPEIRWFIAALREQGHPVQLRSNLAALMLPPCAGLIPFLAEHRVGLVGSLPCYLSANVDAQRGEGAHAASIAAIRALNEAGYGIREELPLHLVYNPGGPALPGPQADLEAAYHKELHARHGLSFHRLLTIANMPIGRFREHLEAAGDVEAYENLLADAFNPATVPGLMCRHQVCIDYDGALYDCDFNLALGSPIQAPYDHVDRFDAEALARRVIVTERHCYGCTAGAGSSCGGALSD